MENKGQKALVIGGSGELGTEVCQVLLAKGFNVAFTFHDNHKKAHTLKQTWEREQGQTFMFQLDLDRHDQILQVVQSAAQALEGLDVLIICSGIATAHQRDEKDFIPKFLEITPQGYDRMMAINVRGAVFACQEAVKIMKRQSAGKIIIVGSIDGIKPEPSPVDYACCKAALWGLTQSLAKEVGKDNILINYVAPGILEGGIAGLLSDELMAEYLKHSALKRVGTFSEVANVIAFLASRKNTYLTGQAVILDGGL